MDIFPDKPSEKNIKSKRAMTLFSFVFLSLIFMDQLVKHFAKNIFANNRFVFSLPLPQWLMFTIYAAALILIISYCLKNFKTFYFRQWLAWILILAGALSNVGERLMLGFVRDYIYIWSGVFNLADGYIITGVIILLAQSVKRKTQNNILK